MTFQVLRHLKVMAKVLLKIKSRNLMHSVVFFRRLEHPENLEVPSFAWEFATTRFQNYL